MQHCPGAWWVVVGAILLGQAQLSFAQEPCEDWAARLVSIQGQVEHKRAASSDWLPSARDSLYCPGDSLRVGPDSRAAVLLPSQTLVRLDQRTTMTLSRPDTDGNFLVELIQGIGYFLSRVPRQLKVRTPFVNGAVEGTEFLVRAATHESRILVFEGVVAAENRLGRLVLEGGEGAAAGPGQAPRKVLVAEPRDAAEWALYYPPIAHHPAAEASSEIGQALGRFYRSDSTAALAALDRVPAGDRDAQYHALRASILLYVGQVEPARQELSRALELDPGQGTAIALQSIVALVLGQTEQAMLRAEEGARLAPSAAAPLMALSYVHQSRLDLDRAYASAETATELEPQNALAWARRAEMELARGNLDSALAAAEKSAALSPHIARTRTTLGFAYLLQFNAAAAAASFARAIELDQADPLPRLGLGIARIRQGSLEQGRRDIEIAVALDPGTSILRSYLGKAYFDEKRDELASRQLGLAKALDPKDPTPWFYDAIREQTANRPVEALEHLQQSIALNDNRAVYRSTLMLDSDLAARSASQARVYEDLGFPRRALVEGWNSVNADPGNWSAHRLLAEAYARRPRQNVARVSELFQSLMYQPINSLPLQAQQQESSLPIVVGSGPTDAARNEFHPLFARDGIDLLVDGVVGSNSTWGDDLVLYGRHGGFSGSAGQFHYETDGFRENNGQEDDIYNAFAQVAINPKLSLQAEYRHREAEQGDLALNFDPDDFSRTLERSIDQDMGRVGARLAPTPASEMLLSVIAADREEIIRDEDGPFPIRLQGDAEAVQGELQYLLRSGDTSFIAGGAYNDIDQNITLNIDLTDLLGAPCPGYSPIPCEGILDADSTHGSAYLYANIGLPHGFLWTLGLSYDRVEYDSLGYEKSNANPKLGVQWDISDAVRVRAAYFEVLKPALVIEQTLEPTQVAGFTQFFDDGEASESDAYGVGIDARLRRDLMLGVEAMHRRVTVPGFSPLSGGVDPLERDEDIALGYVYWTPTDRWALSAHPEYQDISRDGIGPGPAIVRTRSLPLRARYFHPNGFFAGLSGTFVDQTVRETPSGFDQEEESFWVLDLELGYRLPQRRGILTLEVRNLLDEEFLYQDHNFLVTEPVPSEFIPDRAIFAKISLSLDALLR